MQERIRKHEYVAPGVPARTYGAAIAAEPNAVRRTYGSEACGWRVVAAGAALANGVSEDVQQRPVLPPGQAPGKRLRANAAA